MKIRTGEEARSAAARYQTMTLLRAARRSARDREIVALVTGGMTARDAARRFKLSRSRIYQILATKRAPAADHAR